MRTRAKVKREPYSQIKLSLVPEEYLRDGRLAVAQWPDCNIWDIRNFAAKAGYQEWRYFRDAVLTDPSSPFHSHKIYGYTLSGACVVIGYFTHQDSAEWGGKEHRRKTLENQTGWEPTNITDGTSAQEPLEALVAE